MFVPELFASDGFHPNGRAHALWGEEIAALALPLLADGAKPVALSVRDRTLVCRTALVRGAAAITPKDTRNCAVS